MRCCRKVRQDLCSFEGNAQGIRLVHTLHAYEPDLGAGGMYPEIYSSGVVV